MDRRLFFRAIAAAVVAPRAAAAALARWRPTSGVTLTGLAIDRHVQRMTLLEAAQGAFTEELLKEWRRGLMAPNALYVALRRDGLLGPHNPGAR